MQLKASSHTCTVSSERRRRRHSEAPQVQAPQPGVASVWGNLNCQFLVFRAKFRLDSRESRKLRAAGLGLVGHRTAALTVTSCHFTRPETMTQGSGSSYLVLHGAVGNLATRYRRLSTGSCVLHCPIRQRVSLLCIWAACLLLGADVEEPDSCFNAASPRNRQC